MHELFDFPEAAYSSTLRQNSAFTALHLSMADRAARQVLDSRDAVFLDEARAQARDLGGRLPFHVEHLIARPDVPPGLAVALEAPLHLQRRVLIHERHLVDAARGTSRSRRPVARGSVVEVHEVGQVVDPRPAQRLVRAEAARGRARASGCRTRSASGSSCTSSSAECSRTRNPRPTCGSSGSRSPCRPTWCAWLN